MGMDVSDIDQVYNWGIPRTLSSLIQRFGRAARNPNGKGYCTILLPSFATKIHPGSSPYTSAKENVMTKAEFEVIRSSTRKSLQFVTFWQRSVFVG